MVKIIILAMRNTNVTTWVVQDIRIIFNNVFDCAHKISAREVLKSESSNEERSIE